MLSISAITFALGLLLPRGAEAVAAPHRSNARSLRWQVRPAADDFVATVGAARW
ncbi:hypothetical protein [Dactylosporangium sp. NPDC051484]|uniref:hypothetical protein n=1 Tax=Dactylosporangium sp. NPDC051484 TaxID=3154942 RepID=UPI00344B8BBB